MKIRSELNTLVTDIQSAAMSWNGDEKILVGQAETTVAQIAQKVLDQLNNYQIEEKSLKGRIETLQNLLNAFNELRNKSPNPDKEKDLISILRKINQIILSTTQTQKDIENKVSKEIKKKISDSLQYDYIDSDKARITQNAFRLIKNLSPLDQKFANNWVITPLGKQVTQAA